MSGKFSTISSALFTDNKSKDVPQWMENLSDVEIKEKNAIDLDITVKGAFAEKQTINRDTQDYSPRTLEAGLSDTRLITDAKINLAKFLSGKYYKVEGKVTGNTVKLDVKIDGIPAEFNFGFSAEGNKVSNNDTFSVLSNGEYGEYPFSKAGFEECITDIRSNKPKMGSRKVEAVGKYSIINKEEIIRRYNGHLREATDKINELVSEGTLVGVGSNAFASTYDVDFLFPQMEKEAGEAPLPAFDFAPNTEHVAANEHKTAEMLTIDASKILANNFNDYEILNSERNENTLAVTAKVLENNGVTRVASFNFGIQNEKLVAGYENMKPVDNKLLESYASKNSTAKRLNSGSVFTRQLVAERLHKIVRAEIINDLVDNWIDRGLATKITDTTFASEYSFQDLLANVNTKILTAIEIDEINDLSNRAEALEFERAEVKDTGVRDYDDIEVSDETRLANLKNELNKNFKHFKLANFRVKGNELGWGVQNAIEVLDEYYADLIFVHPTTGIENKLNLVVGFYGYNPKAILAEMKGNIYPVVTAANMFSKSPVLTAYLADNRTNVVSGSIVISEKNLRTKLAAYVDTEKIDTLIDSWYQQGLIKNTAAGTYISDYRLEELLDKSGIEILSDEDRKEIALAKQYFGNSFTREAVEDTGVRKPDEYITDDTLLTKANEFISKHFTSFKPEGFKVDGENVSYNVVLFDSETGLRTNMNFAMVFDGTKVASCHANVNGEKVELKNIKKAFAMNDVLAKYLEINPGKRTNAPMLMSASKLVKNLSSISNISLDEAYETIENWENTDKVQKLASNIFASKYTFEQLLSMSNIKSLSDNEIIDRLDKSIRNKGIMVTTGSYINDSDTRQLIEKWSAERMILHAKSQLNKVFKSYEILDAVINNDSYVVTARVVNPTNGLRQKLSFTFLMNDDKPSNISKVAFKDKVADLNHLHDITNIGEAITTFLAFNKPVDRSGKYIITKHQLTKMLIPVTDQDNIDKIISELLVSEIFLPITNETYASEYSASEIVANIDKLGLSDLESGKDQLDNGKQDKAVEVDVIKIMDNDTRPIETTEKTLSPKMQSLKDKIQSTATKAFNQKIITSKKLNQITEMLDNASIEKDLEQAWKELKKYFN